MLEHYRRVADAISIGVLAYDGGEGRDMPIKEVLVPLVKACSNIVGLKVSTPRAGPERIKALK